MINVIYYPRPDFGGLFDFRGLHRMANTVDAGQPIREQVATWTRERNLDYNIEIIAGKIAIKISHAIALANDLKDALRMFFVEIAQTFGLKVIAIQRHDAGRGMSCAFEYR